MRSRAIFLRSPTLPIAQASPISTFFVTTNSYREQMQKTLFSTSTDFVSPTSTNSNLGRPLWIDTDVGFDDLVAIGCCYDVNGDESINSEKSNNETRLVGISTVGGGMTADPLDAVAILRGLLPSRPNTMPIIAGNREGSPSVKRDDPSWLATSREQMNKFCAGERISLPSIVEEDERTNETSDKNLHSTHVEIFATETNGDDYSGKIDLICLGPLTNLAQWLEEIPERTTNSLNSIWILGGNIPIRQSSPSDECREDAEFNFARDPEAVRTVLHHPQLQNTRIHIVPQEVCNRKAFESSFCPQQNLCAAEIIENWLQSTAQTDTILEAETQTNTNETTFMPVESLLPPWLVRLIRTRTFSIYGDPICMYARHSSETSSISSPSTQPKVIWKDYDARERNISTANNDLLTVDSHGRLILCGKPTAKSTVAAAGSELDEKTESGNSVRIAHEMELGQDYLDWLATSMISSFRKRK